MSFCSFIQAREKYYNFAYFIKINKMATYNSHRLIMGKEEIDNFFCLIGDIWRKKNSEMFIE